MAGEPIGLQVELQFLDPILRIAPLTIEAIVRFRFQVSAAGLGVNGFRVSPPGLGDLDQALVLLVLRSEATSQSSRGAR